MEPLKVVELFVREREDDNRIASLLRIPGLFACEFESDCKREEIEELITKLVKKLNTAIKNLKSSRKQLRDKLNLAMELDGHEIAERIFSGMPNELYNHLDAADVLSVIECDGLLIPWEMLFLCPREAETARFIGDMVLVARIANSGTLWMPDRPLSDIIRLDSKKHLAVTHPTLLRRFKDSMSRPFRFKTFDKNSDIMNAAKGNSVICIVAKFDSSAKGMRIAAKDDPYSVQHIKIRTFPTECLLLLFSCRSHASGIAAAIAANSQITVLGAATDIVTRETVKLAQKLGRSLPRSSELNLFEFFKAWKKQEPIFCRLFALQGPWKVILDGNI